jgi:D-alanyl-lipoteichoic acid acyltransferase DltB (MBOAT superfamily)
MLGFNISINFNLPYYSKNPIEFWERWHISLSKWFQDYLYFPLAMHYMRKTKGAFNKYKAHLISMTLIGFWHGANWNFIVFGLYWGLVIIGYIKIREYLNINFTAIKTPILKSIFMDKKSVTNMIHMAMLFFFVCVGWIFFRANSLSDAIYILTHAVTGTLDSIYGVAVLSESIKNEIIGKGLGVSGIAFISCVTLIGFMEIVHFVQSRVDLEKIFTSWPIVLRWAVYYIFILIIIIFYAPASQQFIYFQF